MGGDYAPDAVIEGAVDALGQLPAGDRLVLIGDNHLIRETDRHGGGTVSFRNRSYLTGD